MFVFYQLQGHADSMASANQSPLNSLFGYEIPMPRSELFIAIATVISFLPVVVLVYRVVLGIRHLISKDKKQ